MEDLERMAIFARVVEAKSFSAAARDLKLSKSLVSKQVSQLEKSLGARLLNRTTRALSLTEAGTVLYEYCARIVDELEEAKLAVARLHAEPRGLLRISVSVAFGRLHIAPALPQFLETHPQLKIDMVTTDRFVAVRAVRPRAARAPYLRGVSAKPAAFAEGQSFHRLHGETHRTRTVLGSPLMGMAEIGTIARVRDRPDGSVKNYSACLHQVTDQFFDFGAGIIESEFFLIHGFHYGGATLRSDLHVDGIGHPDQSPEIAIVLPIPEHRHPKILQNFAQF